MKLTLPQMPQAVSRIVSATLLTIVFIVVSIGVSAWLFFGGIQKRLVRIQTAQGVVEASENQQELIRQSRDVLAREREDIARLEALFVPKTQDGIVQFVEALESVASSTAVTLAVTNPATVPNPDGPYAQSFEIVMSGTYARVFDMIAVLEQSGELKRFETLEITKVGDEYQAKGSLVVASE